MSNVEMTNIVEHGTEDLHCSMGPVSSMPGSAHPFPPGSKCDQHDDRLAVRRIQTETDSFGCEYALECQECMNDTRAYIEAHKHDLEECEWCKKQKEGCRDHRDFEEGMGGPMYRVCGDCVTREHERLAQELDESGVWDDDDFGDSGDDPYEDSPRLEDSHMETLQIDNRPDHDFTHEHDNKQPNVNGWRVINARRRRALRKKGFYCQFLGYTSRGKAVYAWGGNPTI